MEEYEHVTGYRFYNGSMGFNVGMSRSREESGEA